MVKQETEFKFLVNKLPSDYDSFYDIEQIYFDGTKKYQELQKLFPSVDLKSISTFRARIIKEDNNTFYVITLKTKGKMTRNEYEEKTSLDFLNSVCLNNIESVIIKKRYLKRIDNYLFEFDEYYNLKTPLITCEVEIESDDINKEKTKIENILKNYFELEFSDVTFDSRYKNSNLLFYFG